MQDLSLTSHKILSLILLEETLQLQIQQDNFQ